MTIRVALHHESVYQYDRLVQLGPQIVRLRPAPHCRTPIRSYSMKVHPTDHFCNWQQDPQGNFLTRLVFPKKTEHFQIDVDLVADMTVINPFDFFLEGYAEKYPFSYEPWLRDELASFLEVEPATPLVAQWLQEWNRSSRPTVQAITDMNCSVQQAIEYGIRLEPGVQTPEETLMLRKGSCRDSAWLMVTLLRHLGLAARFASGYLIQLAADQKSLDGPSGPEADFCDLHAWAEVYLPGAGWVGMDPTSGLLCGEGHIPLACTPDPTSAAPITGLVDPAECEFRHTMTVTRIHEDPRTTKPYTDLEWNRIRKLGHDVDDKLVRMDVRLTMGGEPTFVSIDDMEGPEWNGAAVGPMKRKLSAELIKRLRLRFAPGALLHYGQGKWYPGESLPRWSLSCMWRIDGEPIWHNENLIADETRHYGYGLREAKHFAECLANHLEVDPKWLMPAFEDTYYYLWREQRLPINVTPWDSKLEDPEERERMQRVFQRGLSQPVGIVMPIVRQWWQSGPRWRSGPWPVRPERLFLLPGDSPIGLRLPLDTLPTGATYSEMTVVPEDPFAPRNPLPSPAPITFQYPTSASTKSSVARPAEDRWFEEWIKPKVEEPIDPSEVVRTALCIEPRDGRLYLFMPPTSRLEDYLDLVRAIELTAAQLAMPVVLEGYPPPSDWRLQSIKVTPDPGVIEVNIHPAATWAELEHNTVALYEEARFTRLGTEKFDLDGKHTGTGGGNHVVLGGPTPADSPFLRRPDLLKSLLAYWINHPSLSYLFSGRFIGPTSQSPRVDEGRRDSIYELQIALDHFPKPGDSFPPWLVDRLLRNLLIDLTGNTHRAEFCIDKLYSPDSSTGRLGLLELRALEMPPHPQMSLATQLLLRAMIARFWAKPYDRPLKTWGHDLHDRFMLPQYLWRDFQNVLYEMQRDGFELEESWFAPHFEFRFPAIGSVHYDGVHIALRSAIEPWYVLGEEPGGGGTVRFVDSSVERIEIVAKGFDGYRHQILCNGWIVPLQECGSPDVWVAGVRYRAWQPPSCLHPTIPVHTPLVIDLMDKHAGRSLGGCTYHVGHPGGRNYATFPVNAAEAEARRGARFLPFGHTPGAIHARIPKPNAEFPSTLDLRRSE